MRVVVDLSACDLHGLCVEAAPEVFEIGDDGVLHVLIETPPDGLRASVYRAVTMTSPSHNARGRVRAGSRTSPATLVTSHQPPNEKNAATNAPALLPM